MAAELVAFCLAVDLFGSSLGGFEAAPCFTFGLLDVEVTAGFVAGAVSSFFAWGCLAGAALAGVFTLGFVSSFSGVFGSAFNFGTGFAVLPCFCPPAGFAG